VKQETNKKLLSLLTENKSLPLFYKKDFRINSGYFPEFSIINPAGIHLFHYKNKNRLIIIK